MSFLVTSPGASCIFLAIVLKSEGSKENARRLLAHIVIVKAAAGYTKLTSLFWFDGYLNANLFIPDILSPVVVPCLRGPSNAFF